VLNSGMQKFSHLLQRQHFQIGGWMCFFQWRTGYISRKWWEIRPRLLFITKRKWHRLSQKRWKSLILD